MATIPVWLTGKNVSTFSLTPQSVASNGTLSDGAASSLVGIWDEIDIESEAETEEISAADATRQNHVILKENARIRCTTLLKKDGANSLAALLSANDVFKMICTRGGQSWTIYVSRLGYSENLRKGKSVGIATFQMVDPGTTNPSYA